MYESEDKYNNNISKPLTKISLHELFEWKNGSVISKVKLKSIDNNYHPTFNGEQKSKYLNHRETGGAIWNIFYLHCLNPNTWLIYDQHTHRAMMFIKTGKIVEIGKTNKQKYNSYEKEYLPFINSLASYDRRKVDKALFAFVQLLKIANKYI